MKAPAVVGAVLVLLLAGCVGPASGTVDPASKTGSSVVIEDGDGEAITVAEGFGASLWIPDPATFPAMKFSSFPERQKDDKSIKDLCDAYALAWYLGIPFRDLVNTTRRRYQAQAAHARTMTNSPFLQKAAHHLGVEDQVIGRVLREFYS